MSRPGCDRFPAKVLALRTKGYNLNEAYWLELECVGYGSTYPITKA